MPQDQDIPEREVYTRRLLAKQEGYPLWIPEPDGVNADEYKLTGITEGDVGTLTDVGGFRFLFNIFKDPTDDPRKINCEAPREHRRAEINYKHSQTQVDNYIQEGESIRSAHVRCSKVTAQGGGSTV